MGDRDALERRLAMHADDVSAALALARLHIRQARRAEAASVARGALAARFPSRATNPKAVALLGVLLSLDLTLSDTPTPVWQMTVPGLVRYCSQLEAAGQDEPTWLCAVDGPPGERALQITAGGRHRSLPLTEPRPGRLLVHPDDGSVTVSRAGDLSQWTLSRGDQHWVLDDVASLVALSAHSSEVLAVGQGPHWLQGVDTPIVDHETVICAHSVVGDELVTRRWFPGGVGTIWAIGGSEDLGLVLLDEHRGLLVFERFGEGRELERQTNAAFLSSQTRLSRTGERAARISHRDTSSVLTVYHVLAREFEHLPLPAGNLGFWGTDLDLQRALVVSDEGDVGFYSLVDSEVRQISLARAPDGGRPSDVGPWFELYFGNRIELWA